MDEINFNKTIKNINNLLEKIKNKIENNNFSTVDILNKINIIENELIKLSIVNKATEDELATIKDLLKNREEELSVVYELEKATSSIYQLDELLTTITIKTAEIIKSQDCTIFLKVKNSDELYVKKTQSHKKDQVTKIKVKVGEGIVGWVVKNGKPIIANDLSKEPRWNQKISEEINFPTKTILCVPMIFNNDIIGAIEVINKIKDNFEFTKDDLRILSIIANQTAKAIETTRLLEEVQISERLSTVGKMASSIIHDIKNPMSVIMGYAELIKIKSPENSEYAQKIIESINSLVAMAQDILDFSKGELNLILKKVNIKNFISDFIDFIKPNFSAKKIDIEINIKDDYEIVMDKDKMNRVFMNISSNARDAMKKGGKFSIFIYKEQNKFVFKFIDNGCGIPEQIQMKLFEPFVTYGKTNGTGLGMAITKKIILAHQGSITVNSKVNEGTEIIVEIPDNLEENMLFYT